MVSNKTINKNSLILKLNLERLGKILFNYWTHFIFFTIYVASSPYLNLACCDNLNVSYSFHHINI